MDYNFVILRTEKGKKYARKILNSIKWLNERKYPQHKFDVYDLTIHEFLELMGNDYEFVEKFPERNTIIHARCANPRTTWTIKLRELEEMGYIVVNSVDCIELTSNKLACSLHLQGKVNHPRTWEYNKKIARDEFINLIQSILDENYMFIIAKPITSIEQGANVRKIDFTHGLADEFNWNIDALRNEIDKVPGNKIVIQEYIPYTALHRVIVIGGKALPYTFIDKPEWHPNDWKVSCCLNRTTMKLNNNAAMDLLKLAEQTQKEVGGTINFIDIFEYYTRNDKGNIVNAYTNAEINTACSLNIHEGLAKQAGRKDWNIHYRIAKELIKQLLG